MPTASLASPGSTVVPFPTSENLPSISGSSHIEDSPLSRSSLFVNPPTPYDQPVQIPLSAPPSPPKQVQAPVTRETSPTKVKEGSNGVKSSNSTKERSRQTETFRLARTSSAEARAQGGTITAMVSNGRLSMPQRRRHGRGRSRKIRKAGAVEKVEDRKEQRSKPLKRRSRGNSMITHQTPLPVLPVVNLVP